MSAFLFVLRRNFFIGIELDSISRKHVVVPIEGTLNLLKKLADIADFENSISALGRAHL